MKDYLGPVFHIIHCEGAMESFNAELGKHVPKNKHEQYKERMRVIIRRLGDGHPMSNESFPQEGKLPDKSHFRALKKIPLRAYIWQSKKTPKTYYISHYVYKNYDNLKESDIKKVCDNWRKIEES
ncbi:MAG: hypothetical protein ACXW03_01250 [Methylobacter sp.]